MLLGHAAIDWVDIAEVVGLGHRERAHLQGMRESERETTESKRDTEAQRLINSVAN